MNVIPPWLICVHKHTRMNAHKERTQNVKKCITIWGNGVRVYAVLSFFVMQIASLKTKNELLFAIRKTKHDYTQTIIVFLIWENEKRYNKPLFAWVGSRDLPQLVGSDMSVGGVPRSVYIPSIPFPLYKLPV